MTVTMRAPLVPITLAFLLGILVAASVPLRPGVFVVVLGVGLLAAGVAVGRRTLRRWGVAALLLLWGCLGMGRMAFWEAHPATQLAGKLREAAKKALVSESEVLRRVLTLLDQERAQLVILDLKMEELNGFEILKVLKTRYPELLVIVITGTYEDSAKEVKAMGALECFIKPLELPALRRLVFEVAARLSPKAQQAANTLSRDSLSDNGTPA